MEEGITLEQLRDLAASWRDNPNAIVDALWSSKVQSLRAAVQYAAQANPATVQALQEQGLVKWGRHNPSLIPLTLRVPEFLALQQQLQHLEHEFLPDRNATEFWERLRVQYEPALNPDTNKMSKAEDVKVRAVFPRVAGLFNESDILACNAGMSKHLNDRESGVNVKEKLDGIVYIRQLVLPVMITEFKNEISSATKSDPIAQAVRYYLGILEARKELLVDALPCLLLVIQGSRVSVHGVVYSDCVGTVDTVVEQMLGDFDVAVPDSVGAFAHFLQCVKQCAERLAIRTIGVLRDSLRYTVLESDQARFPFFRELTSLNLRFLYLSDVEATKRVFQVKVATDSPCKPPTNNLIIKFVQGNYCAAAHSLLAQYGFAPRLFGVEDLGNHGWMAVVMEDLSDVITKRTLKHEQLERDALNMLHEAGFVHGDFRDANVLCAGEEGEQKRVFVIDFDWCGKSGEARYPAIELNPEIPWHETARPGLPILREHDLHFHRLRYDDLTTQSLAQQFEQSLELEDK